jgi:hypothetical protein
MRARLRSRTAGAKRGRCGDERGAGLLGSISRSHSGGY